MDHRHSLHVGIRILFNNTSFMITIAYRQLLGFILINWYICCIHNLWFNYSYLLFSFHCFHLSLSGHPFIRITQLSVVLTAHSSSLLSCFTLAHSLTVKHVVNWTRWWQDSFLWTRLLLGGRPMKDCIVVMIT